MLTKENVRLTKANEAIADVETLKKTTKKQSEIQKLLETNMQTLENRCELLELQNEQIKKEKDQLQAILSSRQPPKEKAPRHVSHMSITSPTFQGLFQFNGLEGSAANRKVALKEDFASGHFGIKPHQQTDEATLLTVSSVSNSGKKENNGSISNSSFQENWLSARTISDQQDKVPGKITRNRSNSKH